MDQGPQHCCKASYGHDSQVPLCSFPKLHDYIIIDLLWLGMEGYVPNPESWNAVLASEIYYQLPWTLHYASPLNAVLNAINGPEFL